MDHEEALRECAKYLEEYGPQIAEALNSATKMIEKNCRSFDTGDLGRQLAFAIGTEDYGAVLIIALELLRRGDSEYVFLQLSRIEVDETKPYGKLFSDVLPTLLLCSLPPEAYAKLQNDLHEAMGP